VKQANVTEADPSVLPFYQSRIRKRVRLYYFLNISGYARMRAKIA